MQATNPYDTLGQTPSSHVVSSARTLHIKKIDVLSAGKLLGCLYALLGLFIGGILSLLALVGVAAGGGGGDAVVGGLLTGVGAIIIIPIFYGFIGFIGGLIGAVLYNVVAGIVGGIRIDVEF